MYGGTRIVHKKSELIEAIVVGTGWNTWKGELLGSVLYSTEEVDRFYRDFIKFLFYLFFIHFTFAISVVYFELNHSVFRPNFLIGRCIDIIKQCFPPSLLFVMTASVQVSSWMLAKKKIYTLKSNKIVEGGAVTTVCFDKTGTLTELDIQVYGYILRVDNSFESFSNNLNYFQDSKLYPSYIKGMSVCHSLEIIDQQLLGDPLEISVFNAT